MPTATEMFGDGLFINAKDLIYQVVTVASPQTRFSNLSKTRTLGVEGNFNFQWEDFFELGGNITYQEITDQADFVYNESYTKYRLSKELSERFPPSQYTLSVWKCKYRF